MARLRQVLLLLAVSLFVSTGWSQATTEKPAPDSQAPSHQATDPQTTSASVGVLSADSSEGKTPETVDPKVTGGPSSSAAPLAQEKKTYIVPAGTKVLLQLKSSINTKSAKPGDGVYLASTFPVVVGNHVMIPTGVYVQGVVDRVVRAGHVKGKSQFDMHFTSMIFPNGTVVDLPGAVNSLPGAKKQSVKDDGEGTIEQAGDKGRNAGEVAKIAIPTGATVGTIGGLGSGHPLAGGVAGVGAGLAAVGIAALFTRGADVNLESGSQVEMVLQRPLILEDENLSSAASSGGVGANGAFVPAVNQPRPMQKPTLHRDPMLCPPGSLGCS